MSAGVLAILSSPNVPHSYLSLVHREGSRAASTILNLSARWSSHGTAGRSWSSSTGSASRACCVTAPLLWTGWTSRPTKLCWQPAASISAPSSWTRKMWCIWTSAMQQVGFHLSVGTHVCILLFYVFHLFFLFHLPVLWFCTPSTVPCLNNSKCTSSSRLSIQ